jgi:hypothetical protein
MASIAKAAKEDMEKLNKLKNKKKGCNSVFIKGIDPEDIEIMLAQKEIKAMGWQWQEHIFNDHFGKGFECCVDFTKETDPCWEAKGSDVGWGRFSRVECWRKALAYFKARQGA